MTTTSIIIFLFLIALIIFNVWNAISLKQLIKRPLKNDQLNDKNYWELKYKMQYMVTVFSVILAIIAFIGYNTVDNVKDSVRKEFQEELDSTKTTLLQIKEQIQDSKSDFETRVANTDSMLNHYRDMLLGLSNRTDVVKKSISVSDNELSRFKQKISEINSKNIIQQNIYIVDNIEYKVVDINEQDPTKQIVFSGLSTISGDKLPLFKKPPFILVVSNDGSAYTVRNVTTSSFDLICYTYQGDRDVLRITLFITENP